MGAFMVKPPFFALYYMYVESGGFCCIKFKKFCSKKYGLKHIYFQFPILAERQIIPFAPKKQTESAKIQILSTFCEIYLAFLIF